MEDIKGVQSELLEMKHNVWDDKYAATIKRRLDTVEKN